jgi:hypothetical protein
MEWLLNEHGVLLALVAVAAVVLIAAKIGYREGYQRDQADLLHPREPTEAERDAMLMKLTLPRWRRVAGSLCAPLGSLAFLPFMILGMRYGSGWAFVAAFVAAFVGLGAGVKLGEWFWKPYREAMPRNRQGHRASP